MSRTVRRGIWSYSSMHQRTILGILLVILAETLVSRELLCNRNDTDGTKCACEDQLLSISCTRDSVIRISGANFGRTDNETCNDGKFPDYRSWNLNCRSVISMKVVSRKCSNKTNCTVRAGFLFLEDPCPGTGKYLIVNYTCAPEDETAVTSIKPECKCPNEIRRKVHWPTTDCNNVATAACPNNKKQLKANRWCAQSGWTAPNLVGCITEEIQLIKKSELESLRSNFSIPSLNEMMTKVEYISQRNDLYGGDLYALNDVMAELVGNSLNNSKIFKDSNADNFSNLTLISISNFLSDPYIEAWNELNQSDQSITATRMLVSMEGSSTVLAKSSHRPTSIHKTAPGIELKIDVININDAESKTSTVTFKNSDVQFDISLEDVILRADEDDGLGRAVFALYDDIEKWLKLTPSNENMIHAPTKCPTNGTVDNDTCIEPKIITKVVSASIISSQEHSDELNKPIRFTLHHKLEKLNWTTVSCVFWKFSKDDFVGHWSDEGCKVVSSNSKYTTCECYHLTNFAVLMSATHIPMEHSFALHILTYIGCGVSVAALILTIIIYVVTWDEVKSHQTAVLLNLCVALVTSNIIFMFGISHTDPKIGCTVVAALLHYFYLAAFFIMLVEGIQLLIYVLFVFRAKRNLETSLLLVAAWVLPLIIVSISLVVTKAEGYGNNNACWLSVEYSLIWAFIGPVLCVTGVNTVIVVIVLVKISATRMASSKNNNNTKIRGTIVNLATLSPILGITWWFGVFSDKSHIVAYIFTIVNSLQGLFIFIFHALFHVKKFRQRLSAFALQYLCCNRNSMRQTRSKDGMKKISTKQEYHDLKNCPEKLMDQIFPDTVEMMSTCISDSTAITFTLSSDQSYSESVIESSRVPAEIYTDAVAHSDVVSDSDVLATEF